MAGGGRCHGVRGGSGHGINDASISEAHLKSIHHGATGTYQTPEPSSPPSDFLPPDEFLPPPFSRNIQELDRIRHASSPRKQRNPCINAVSYAY